MGEVTGIIGAAIGSRLNQVIISSSITYILRSSLPSFAACIVFTWIRVRIVTRSLRGLWASSWFFSPGKPDCRANLCDVAGMGGVAT